MPTSATHFVIGNALKPPFPAGLEEAVFGLGCFWGAERKFWQTPGVWSTSAGYAGGTTPNPTYEEVCSGRTGHTEVVRVIFDPKQVSYEQLVKTFFESHDPTQGMRQGGDIGTQYRSAIYTTSDEQERTAEAALKAYGDQLRAVGYGAITTELRDTPEFFYAEGLPPAISRKEPGRLRRNRWNWRVLSYRVEHELKSTADFPKEK